MNYLIDAASLNTAAVTIETIKQRLRSWMAIQDEEKIAKTSIQQCLNSLEFIFSKKVTEERKHAQNSPKGKQNNPFPDKKSSSGYPAWSGTIGPVSGVLRPNPGQKPGMARIILENAKLPYC